MQTISEVGSGPPTPVIVDSRAIIQEEEWLEAARRNTEHFRKHGSLVPLVWVLAEGSQIPDNAVPSGEDHNGSSSYTARAPFQGRLHIGKASPRFSGAIIVYAGREHIVANFEVLVRASQLRRNAFPPESKNSLAKYVESDIPRSIPEDLILDREAMYAARLDDMDKSRMSISVDFGTTFSGVAYASPCIALGAIQQVDLGSFETCRKVPTCILYDEHGQILAWGPKAEGASSTQGRAQCEWFKLFLEPRVLRDGAVDPRLPRLPPGKTAMNVVVDYLTCLWEDAKEEITRRIGSVADLNSANVVVTCPAVWNNKGCDLMREAVIEAGLVQSAHAGDVHWRDRLRIITEPEAAAVHCARFTELHKLRPGQNFMICDAGGGTVDLTCYKVIGQVCKDGDLEIAEMCAQSGANCGSFFLDLRFQKLVKTLLVDHPAHLDAPSLANFMYSFKIQKLTYRGEIDDDTFFYFTCFNVQDPDDPSVGLINGELAIPGILIRQEVFDPVVNQVLEMIRDQLGKIEQRIDLLLLVGGFARSEYLFKKVEATFSDKIKVVARPFDADTATVRGAAQYGLSRKITVSTVIVPRAYIMKMEFPAEPEDWRKRPSYIKENNAGVPICENRQIAVSGYEGSSFTKETASEDKNPVEVVIVLKVITGLSYCSKFSQDSQDCNFVAVLYTSDSDKIIRYTDEGETAELCRWTIDLSSLPTFQQNASVAQPNGFYTDFELGLEMDVTEVRGVLFVKGQEWGRVVLDVLA